MTQYSGVDEENGAGPLKEKPDAEGMFLWGGGGGAKGGPNACKPMVRMEGADGERIESLQKPQRLETGVKEVKQG